MTLRRTVACVTMLMAVAALPAYAQAPTTAPDQRLYEVKTKDGELFVGYLQVDAPERVVLRTPGGATIELARVDIVSIKEATGTLSGTNYLPADPNPTRLFFGPTGRALKKGETYLGVYEFIMPIVQTGVTDRFSIGGGTPIYFGGGDHAVWLTPKLQVQKSDRVSTSIGLLHFFNIGDGAFGVAYAASTIGNTNDAFTVGLGWAYETYSQEHDGTAVVMAGAESRLSRRVKFITENYLVGGVAILSGGVRFLGESLSADLGLVAPIGEGEGFAFPIVNFVWKFK